jgi:hypothetical protein
MADTRTASPHPTFVQYENAEGHHVDFNVDHPRGRTFNTFATEEEANAFFAGASAMGDRMRIHAKEQAA